MYELDHCPQILTQLREKGVPREEFGILHEGQLTEKTALLSINQSIDQSINQSVND